MTQMAGQVEQAMQQMEATLAEMAIPCDHVTTMRPGRLSARRC